MVFRRIVFDIAQGIQGVSQGKRELPNKTQCRQHVEHYHSWLVIAQQLKSVYKSIG